MAQVNNLWSASGLKEQAFVALMQKARQRTRRAQGRQRTEFIGGATIILRCYAALSQPCVTNKE